MASALIYIEAPLPKSGSGRKAHPIDEGFASQLVKALKERTTVDVDGEVRPRSLGSPATFATKSKANADGRRYADRVSKEIGKKVSVNVYSTEKDKPPFQWRIFVPLSENAPQTATAA